MKKRSDKEKDLELLKTELAQCFDHHPDHLSGHHGRGRHQAAALRSGRRRKLSRGEKYAGGTRRRGHAPRSTLLKDLAGPNSIAYTTADPVALAKALTKYAKDVPHSSLSRAWWTAAFFRSRKSSSLRFFRRRKSSISKIMFLLNAPAQRVASVALRGIAQYGRGSQRSGQGQQVWGGRV